MPDPQSPPSRLHRLPTAFYNTITLVGAVIAGVSIGLIIFLNLLETFAEHHSPYMGVVAYVVLPGFMILGILIGIAGIVRQIRRRNRGLSTTERLPRIDLNDPTHLRAALLFSIGGVVFLVASGFGSFKAYEYTDSDEFCGKMCHSVMKPEYTAFQESPHARVGCIKCHIGPGAEWFVKSKLSGAYQVYSVLFNKYSRPIETPIKNLRPSRDTCEQCHWPAHFLGEKMVVHDYFGYEDENTHWRLKLLMKTGGGGAGGAPAHGIHWHVAEQHEISYVATDEKRLEIPWVKFRSEDGVEKIYRSTEIDFDDEELAIHDIRTMDCIDCHNRPTHHYNPPAKLVNRALSNGLINPAIPGIKGLLVELMEAEYETETEALEAIATGVMIYYAEEHPELADSHAADLQQAVSVSQELFATNIFPEMKVSWREFPDHIGHLSTPGCFRCHDGLHETDQGEVISRECNLCHAIVAQEKKTGEMTESLASLEYVHPEDIDEEWKYTNCSECHGE